MVAYHYWKCYYKDGVSFQTAKLFSIEVDYYNFGTCEITDGAYFCGDHSCQTFKHIGNLDGNNGLPTTKYEHLNRPTTADRSVYSLPYADRHFQAGPQSDGKRMDQTSAMYYEHISLKLDWASLVAQGHTRYNRTVVHESLSSPGDCRKHCDVDDRCKIYLENKPTGPRGSIDFVRCQLITADEWASEMPTFPSSLVANSGWNTYSKYSNPKPRTWLHAPIHLANPVVLHQDISTTRGDVIAGIPTGRRLDGVY